MISLKPCCVCVFVCVDVDVHGDKEGQDLDEEDDGAIAIILRCLLSCIGFYHKHHREVFGDGKHEKDDGDGDGDGTPDDKACIEVDLDPALTGTGSAMPNPLRHSGTAIEMAQTYDVVVPQAPDIASPQRESETRGPQSPRGPSRTQNRSQDTDQTPASPRSPRSPQSPRTQNRIADGDTDPKLSPPNQPASPRGKFDSRPRGITGDI